jgi:hypothetical protein
MPEVPFIDGTIDTTEWQAPMAHRQLEDLLM